MHLTIEKLILGTLWFDADVGESFDLALHCSYDSDTETVTLNDVTSPDGQHAVDDCPDHVIEAWREELECHLNELADNYL